MSSELAGACRMLRKIEARNSDDSNNNVKIKTQSLGRIKQKKKNND